ncbi:MAG: excinuclease ABC subunit UvrC [Lacibacter sp.]
MTQETFLEIAPTLPRQPGIYKYYDSKENLLYVGKAKNIRKRVSSYFNKNQQSFKTQELVRRIASIEFTIVSTEQDAFLLENALIKQFRPHFNIELKDGKTYPFIVIKKEPFPRVLLTRRSINDGSEYLGPFTSVFRIKELLEFIKQNIPLRNCTLNLSESNIRKGKYKVCLEYHLGNCKGPCEGLQTQDEYQRDIQHVRDVLKGNLKSIILHFKEEMQVAVQDLKFEQAERILKKIEFLENYQSRSTIVNPKMGNADVLSLIRNGDKAFINYLMVENGTIIQTENLVVDCKLDETEQEILEQLSTKISNTFRSNAHELIVPVAIELLDDQKKVTVPKAGDKKKLLELSQNNVRYFFNEYRKKAISHTQKDDNNLRPLLEQVRKDLMLKNTPLHIECFDNSNFQGSYPVSAMVCFRNGKPSKTEYRHYNIKTVQGINDFASMKEVVYRRYQRLLEEQGDLPDLVIIDGGKGQLSAAMESIQQLGLSNKMTVIGLAKNVEELFYNEDQESLKLPYQSKTLLLLRQIRDEVHRFGVEFHRKKRSEGTFKNALEEIPGIGAKTATTLLKHFRSIAAIKKASVDEIAQITGKEKAVIVDRFLKHK